MRRTWIALATALALAACALPPVFGPRGETTASELVAADAATALLVGERISVERFVSSAGAEDGQDPLIRLTLTNADGRAMVFTAANHTPHDVMAQSPAGPLAQIMGLFGEEAPALYTYSAQSSGDGGEPFFCAPNGPYSIGLHEAPDGAIMIVALQQPIAFETRPDGVEEALPYSPDQVCARLRFRNG
jgi:hypothetical protein